MKIKTLLIALLVFVCLMQAVNADIIVPGTKIISYCQQITNTNEFPDYVFLIKLGGPMSHGIYELIEENKCIGERWYKFSSGALYAIKKSDFNESEINFQSQWNRLTELEKQQIKNNNSWIFKEFNESILTNNSIENDSRYSGVLYEIKNAKEYLTTQIYFEYDNKVINLNTTFRSSYGSVLVLDPREDITKNFRIVKDANANLKAELYETKYKYDWSVIMYYSVVPLIAFLIILYLMIRRTKWFTA
jgi:hypothetical protein